MEKFSQETVEALKIAEELKRRYSNNCRFIKNCFWKDAGLSVQIGRGSTKESIAESLMSHDLVVGFLRDHCHEEDADEKYFYPDGHIKYYQVLDLAEVC